MTTSNETSHVRYAKEAKSVPIEISYSKSATNSEQHSVPRSIAMHLLPGILTGAAFVSVSIPYNNTSDQGLGNTETA